MGVAKIERFIKSFWRVVFKQGRDVIICCTLEEILKRRTKHLWVCPECADEPSLLTNYLIGLLTNYLIGLLTN